MATDLEDGLFAQYMDELAYLQNAGSAFARKYPRVAGSLELSGQGSTDPHVQRVIESFAFLTARLQRSYAAQVPDVPAALLDVLYPSLTAPIPSMTVAAFRTEPAQSRALSGIVVPSNTTLFTAAGGQAGELTCRFRTCYPVTLWPIEVENAWLEPPSLYAFLDSRPDVERVIRIRLRCQGNRRFDEFSPPVLRFFLPPSSGSRDTIYETLFSRLLGVGVATVAPETEAPAGPAAGGQWLNDVRVREVGFTADEDVLPSPPMSFQAYRLLQEFFAFSDKFNFIDVGELPKGCLGSGSQADLLFLLKATPRQRVSINANSFALGCTPAINLFQRISEPIRLDQTRLDYVLVADIRRQSSTEIHSIDRVSRAMDRPERGQTIHPLFSFRDSATDDGGDVTYYARRRPTPDGSDQSSEFVISFVDPHLDLTVPAGDTVFARVNCTNRGLAEHIDQGARFHLEVDLPLAEVSCLMRPTSQLAPPTHSAALWRLVSHLSANHLTLTDGETGIGTLREILKLYSASGDAGSAALIGGLTTMSTRRIVRQIGQDAWRGFCRGMEITLTFDADRTADGGLYLFGSVLSRFFGLYAAVNSFTELVIILKGKQRDETWRWPALTGEATLL